MAKSVKLADEMLVEDARAESELQSRSLAGQITHWARIGRAIERSGKLDHAKLTRVLSGEIGTSTLTLEEKAVWSEHFLTKMSEPGPDENAFFEQMRQRGGAVGIDPSGKIVRTDGQPAE